MKQGSSQMNQSFVYTTSLPVFIFLAFANDPFRHSTTSFIILITLPDSKGLYQSCTSHDKAHQMHPIRVLGTLLLSLTSAAYATTAQLITSTNAFTQQIDVIDTVVVALTAATPPTTAKVRPYHLSLLVA